MHAYRQSKRAIAALCAVLLLISLLPVRTAGAEAAVTHVLSAALKGDASDWAYVEQPVTGITTNTDYSFGVWIKGSGIVTIKASANGTTLAYKRAAASTDWTYESVSFNSGAKSGTVTFSIVDSAATAFPQSETAGQMYLNDAYFGLAASGPNLLQNGGFEDGLGGWNKYVKNVFAVVEEADSPAEPPVDTTVYSGKYALQANLLGQASNWAYLTQQIGGIVSGNVYEMGVWVKGSGAATFKISKGSGSSTAVKFVRQLATGDWTYWTADYTATSNDNLYLSVYDSAAASGSGITQAQAAGTMYMDDLFFGVKGTAANLAQNPGFESGLTGWTVANTGSPAVFSVMEGVAENGPGNPTPTPTGTATPTATATPTPTPTPTASPTPSPTPTTDPDNPDNIHSGNRSMQAVTLGKKSGWKTVTQQVGGIVPNTDYTFGAWIKGSGAVTIKTATNSGENLQFIRPKATNTWTYVSASFNSGTFSGTVVFTISDSAGSALPEAEAAGTMYVDDVFFGMTGETNLLLNGGFEEQLKFWGGDKGTVFTRYPNRSDNPPAQQYEGIDNLGVYVWDRNPEGVTDFGDWIGRSPYLAEDFLEQNTWSDLEGGVRLAPWKDSPYAGKMLWAAYPFPKSGGSLAEAASGAYNDHYRALGENLIANGMAKATIRFGHEFNGGWYIWSIGNANDPNHLQKAQDFAEAFRQFVTTLRSIEGQAFKFVWNPSTSVWGVDLEAAFPGRDYADFVGIDHYDQSWAQNNGTSIYGSAYQNADPAERLRRQQIAWNAEVNDGNWGLNMIAQFAEDQGVPLAICEWGLAARADGMGGADNPYFIEKMHEWIENNNVAWHVYFNVSADDGDHDLYDTVAFPLASAKFSELWDPNGAPDTSPAIEPADIPGIGAQYVKVEGEDGILTGSANRYHGDPWASGGEFAVMYKSVNALTFTNVNKADGGLAIVYQGWESDQKASLYVNGVLVKPNIPFPQHGRSWSNSYGYVVLNDVQIPAGATVKLQINPSDELNNYGSLKIDYLLLLGATGAYVPGDASDITDVNDSVSVPSRTSYSHSGTWALAANVKGTGDTNGSSYNTKPTLTAGKSYTFGAWIKGSGKMALVIQNTSNWAEVLVKPFQATGQWQYVAATYTPAATGAYNIKLGDRDTSGSMGRIYIDDVKLAGTEDGVAVIDDNFEDGGVKWWHPANYFVMTDFSQNTGGSDAHSGKWAMKVASSAAAQDQETTLDAQLKLKAGVAYTFKLWLKGTGDLKVRLQNGQNGQLIADEPFSAAGEWREYAFTVTPAESSSYSLKLFSDGTNNALYVDDLLLYASGQNNLLPNSDFELGQAGWLENGTFSVTDASEVAFDQGLLDGLDNLSKAKETGNLTIDGTNAGWYGEDPARAVRQTDGEGYLVYELPAGIRSISVAMYEPAGADGASVTASVSDGNGFEALALTKDRYPNAAKADMPLTVYGSYDIPEGKTLIRVTLPDRSGGQLSEVALNVTAAPVTANPGAGEITAGQSVTLATAEADGTIYYRFASSPDKMRYIGPIAMAHSGSIAAWTEKDGKRKSIVRTFSYVNADEVLVDAYGQIRGAEFTGKVHGESEFEQAAIADESFREGLSAPSDRDEYGGLSGSRADYQLSKTGYFHTEKLNGKSVMVDPLGNLYFNLAVNGTGYVDETFTVVAGRENVYEWLPAKTGQFQTAYDGNGNFSFYVANLIRQTGQPFKQADYSERSVEFVKSLGFNGLGAWSKASGMPYVAWLPMPNLKIGDSGLFDIFHPDMAAQMDAGFQALSANRDDHLLIGYMFGNELPYNKLRSAVPAASAATGSKVKLVDMLEEQYGTIEQFNAAWAMNAASFEALKRLSFTVKTGPAAADMDRFTGLYLDELYKQVAYYTKKYDPNHLAMGDRWLAGVMNDSKLREALAANAGKYMDVLTYNYYTYDPNLSMIERLYELAGGKPFIMTEFHYGDPTSGLTFAARMAEDEHEKGMMYSNYVEQAAASGYIVGTNWFSYLDQAPTGRWFEGLNGEAGAIGLLNVVNRPYKDFLQSVSATNAKIYDVMLGSVQPYDHTFKPSQVERTSDKELHVAKTTNAPIIGDFTSDWGDAATANLTDVDLVLGVMKTGIGGQMSLTWDDEAFYLNAHIDDPTPMQSPNVIKGMTVPAAKAYLWAGDAIELFFGPEHVNEGGSMQFNDSQILLAAAPDADGSIQTAFYWAGYRADEQPAVEMAAKLNDDGLGYTLQAKIKFADIGVANPSDGTAIRYDMGFDEGGPKGRERQFYWNGVDGNSANREKWGTMILKDASEPPADSAAGAPGKPVLSSNNGYDNGLQDGSYEIGMNMWWGNNGTAYKLYENDVLIDTRTLSANSPNAQRIATPVAGKKNGIYRYYAELTNKFGTTRSDELTVQVTQASPAAPVLSHNNWDQDGNFDIGMNMWWGTNGTTYKLYENGKLIDTQTLADHTPNAQSAVTAIRDRAPGIYQYRCELINGAGAAASQTIEVKVI